MYKEKTIEECIEYDQMMVQLLTNKDYTTFKEQIIRNGILTGSSAFKSFSYNTEQAKLDKLSDIHKEFNEQCKKIVSEEKYDVMSFIIKHFEFTYETNLNIAKKSILSHSVLWNKKIAIPLLRENPEFFRRSEIVRAFLHCQNKEVKDLYFSENKIVNVSNIRLVDAETLDEIKSVIEIKQQYCSNLVTMKEQLKPELHNYMDSLIYKVEANRISPGNFWENFNYLKNLDYFKTNNSFSLEYKLLNMCAKHIKNTNSNLITYVNTLLIELMDRDQDFNKNIKYIVKSFKFVKEIIKNIEFKNKLTDDLSEKETSQKRMKI